jgi:hypothetical protein
MNLLLQRYELDATSASYARAFYRPLTREEIDALPPDFAHRLRASLLLAFEIGMDEASETEEEGEQEQGTAA